MGAANLFKMLQDHVLVRVYSPKSSLGKPAIDAHAYLQGASNDMHYKKNSEGKNKPNNIIN